MRRAMVVELAERLRRLRPSALGEMRRLIARSARGRREILRLDALDLGLRPPLLPPVGAGGEAAAAAWLQDRFGCALGSGGDLVLLRGPLPPHALLALAFVDPGGAVVAPDPGAPLFATAALLAGGEPTAEEAGNAGTRSAARLQFLAPGGPPAGWIETRIDRDAVVREAILSSRILASDLSWALLTLAESHPDVSLLSHARGAAAGVEIVTFDPLFGAGGSPFSIVAGNRDVVAGVRRVAEALGIAAVAPAARSVEQALDEIDGVLDEARRVLRGRRDLLLDGLQRLGYRAFAPAAGLGVWVCVPRGYGSVGWSRMLLTRGGVLVRPGVDFGERGEGAFAISLAAPEETLSRAIRRLDGLASRRIGLRGMRRRAARAPKSP